jgi:hypothetical protein
MGFGYEIRDPENLSRIQGQKGTGSLIRIRNTGILCEALLPIFQEAGPSNNKRKRSEDHLAVEDGEVFQRLRELCPQRTPAFIKVRRRSCLQETFDKNAKISKYEISSLVLILSFST